MALVHLTRGQARHVAKLCPAHAPFLPEALPGLSPCGMRPSHARQVDVTRYAPFGCVRGHMSMCAGAHVCRGTCQRVWWAHVNVDNFPGYVFATCQARESSVMLLTVVFPPLQSWVALRLLKQTMLQGTGVQASNPLRGLRNFPHYWRSSRSPRTGCR